MSIENIEAHRHNAANSYAAMVVYIMKNNSKEYPLNVTRAVMNFIDSYELGDSEDIIWENYAELMDIANMEQINLEHAPLIAIRQMAGG